MTEDQIIRSMALVRVISATIELSAAFLIYRSFQVENAFRINAVLGLVGPVIFLTVTALGLVGLAGKMSLAKGVTILLGVGLILAGTRS